VSSENSQAVVCANPDCKVAETGRCVDGLELNVCPQHGRVGTEQKAAYATTVAVPLPSAEIRLLTYCAAADLE
jgi:hypothetical protein